VGGASSAQIIGNTIQNNSWGSFGGGISLFAAGSPLVKDNVIIGNSSGNWGAGISMENDVSGAVIVQNSLIGNSSPDDAGIYWSNPPAALVNNTITDGPAATGGSTGIVVANALNSAVVIVNNVIVATNAATNAFYCVFNDIQNPTGFYNNDIFSTKGPAYGGICTDQTGTHGNISASPTFVASGNVRLKGGSPAIDAGSNTAPNLPSTDLSGNPRIVNGNGGPTAIVDMGAYEFLPVTLTPR
jgi:hypothetical protein